MNYFDEYYERFGDIFPTMFYMNSTEEELIKKIRKCLKEGKRIEKLDNISLDVDIIY